MQSQKSKINFLTLSFFFLLFWRKRVFGEVKLSYCFLEESDSDLDLVFPSLEGALEYLERKGNIFKFDGLCFSLDPRIEHEILNIWNIDLNLNIFFRSTHSELFYKLKFLGDNSILKFGTNVSFEQAIFLCGNTSHKLSVISSTGASMIFKVFFFRKFLIDS